MSTKLPYTKKLLNKSRDASNMCESRIPCKEFWETHNVYKKGILFTLKKLGIRRFNTIHDFAGGHGANIPFALARDKAKYGIVHNIFAPKSSKRLWSHYPRLAARMDYRIENIYETEYNLEDNSLVLGLHACRGLSLRICDIGIENNSPVIIVPCCVGRIDPFFQMFNNINHYDKWCLTVGQKLQKAGYKLTTRQIRASATPVNTIIIGLPPKL